MNAEVKIAVVGDIHEQWELEDHQALKSLQVDLVLFVGDLGNESVPVVRKIASLNLPKAVILGNHDAWYTATEWGQKKCPYNRHQENWVQDQLDLLGESHLGYRHRNFPHLNLSVVGGRPFTWGGPEWKYGQFYQQWYGVRNFSDSAERIIQAASQATAETLIFLGHNGPTGLGEEPEAPCGRDWKPLGGDFGDPDLALAIQETRQQGKRIPLVTFGHMHHNLRHTKQELRRCIFVDGAGTVYLNAARVPRIQGVGKQKQRNFSLVSLKAGQVCQISLVWVGHDLTIATEEILYRAG